MAGENIIRINYQEMITDAKNFQQQAEYIQNEFKSKILGLCDTLDSHWDGASQTTLINDIKHDGLNYLSKVSQMLQDVSTQVTQVANKFQELDNSTATTMNV